MASKINAIIPKQNAELVRDRLRLIITEELANQKLLLEADDEDVTFIAKTVNIDRYTRFDQTELPAINISYANTDFDLQDLTFTRGATSFFIDFYIHEDETEETEADRLSNAQLLRLMGMVKFILTSGDYPTLDFNDVPTFIGNRTVKSMGIFNKADVPDALTTTIGRLVYEVTISDDCEATTQGVPLEINNTSALFINNDKGYFYQYIIP